MIALLSTVVITLVVWLIALFLSVTEGIEKNWLDKMTALNAPLRIRPTQEYFASYYYNVDKYCAASNYMSKAIGEKAKALISDPYNPKIDQQLPPMLSRPDRDPSGTLRDPVKGLYAALDDIAKQSSDLRYQDTEIAGALLRLEMIRKDPNAIERTEVSSQLTNVSYLTSFAENNPHLDRLLLPISADDVNQLLYLAKRGETEAEGILEATEIKTLKAASDIWRLPESLLPRQGTFAADAYFHSGEITHLTLPTSGAQGKGKLCISQGKMTYCDENGEVHSIDEATPLFSYGGLELDVDEIFPGLFFQVRGALQQIPIAGTIPITGLSIGKASSLEGTGAAAPWVHKDTNGVYSLPTSDSRYGILAPKSYRDSGVRIGDKGTLGYTGQTTLGTKELRLPIYIAGFYDPGIMPVGNKCVLVPKHITQAVNASEGAYSLDPTTASGIQVWFSNLKDAPAIKEALIQKLHAEGLDKYWTIETFREFDFARDLMQQFSSDKYLFTLIGVIILLVACTNIISLLVLLVSDKKKEIGILIAMGAKRRSIGAIFAFAGGFVGFASCAFGLTLAYFTLQNIDSVVGLLSALQGHDAFNPQFFGTSLPKTLSTRALWFAAVTTPLLSLVAGLIPAIKAARMSPTETLRSE